MVGKFLELFLIVLFPNPVLPLFHHMISGKNYSSFREKHLEVPF